MKSLRPIPAAEFHHHAVRLAMEAFDSGMTEYTHPAAGATNDLRKRVQLHMYERMAQLASVYSSEIQIALDSKEPK